MRVKEKVQNAYARHKQSNYHKVKNWCRKGKKKNSNNNNEAIISIAHCKTILPRCHQLTANVIKLRCWTVLPFALAVALLLRRQLHCNWARNEINYASILQRSRRRNGTARGGGSGVTGECFKCNGRQARARIQVLLSEHTRSYINMLYIY